MFENEIESGHQVSPETAAEGRWNLVLKYECL